jgi:hypothetical protein
MSAASQNTLIANAKLHWKHFDQYFADAAFFTYDAFKAIGENAGGSNQAGRFTRVAIIQSALALESAANCCLDVLRLQKRALQDFEKLQTLAKFELFLQHVRPRTRLDREHALVKPIQNLISCRNTYVHSKVQVENATNSKLELKFWNPLGLPQNSMYWQPLHAVKIFTVLSDFLNFYFFNLLGFPYEGHQGRSMAAQILSSSVQAVKGENLPGDVGAGTVRGSAWHEAGTAARAWDLDFAFLGVYTSGTGNEQTFPKRQWGDYSHCEVDKLKFPIQPVVYNVPDGFGVILVGKDLPRPAKSSTAGN